MTQPLDALLKVLRQAEQIEGGLEDAPFDETAAHECQELGWLDREMMLTRAGRRVLRINQGRGSNP